MFHWPLLVALLSLSLSSLSIAETKASDNEPSLWDSISQDYERTFPKYSEESTIDTEDRISNGLRRFLVGLLAADSYYLLKFFDDRHSINLSKNMGPGVDRRHQELLKAKEELNEAKTHLKNTEYQHRYMAPAGEPQAVSNVKEAQERLAKADATLKEAKYNYKGVKKTLAKKLSSTEKIKHHLRAGKFKLPMAGCAVVTLGSASDVLGTFLIYLQNRQDNVISPTCSLIKIGVGNPIAAVSGSAGENTRGASNEEQEGSQKESTSSSAPSTNHRND